MARLNDQTNYPVGTPAAGDLVPFISDPAGTPALKVANVADLGGGGGDPGGEGAVLAEEFDGTSGLTWTPVAAAIGAGHAVWQVGNGILSAAFGGQSNNVMQCYLTARPLAVGETIEIAFRQGGAQIANFAGLILTTGVVDASQILVAGEYYDGAYHLLARDGTIAAVTGASVSLYHGLNIMYTPLRSRITRVTNTTYQYASSVDGVSWLTEATTAQAWSSVPTHLGVCVSCWGSDTAQYGDVGAAFEFIRIYPAEV